MSMKGNYTGEIISLTLEQKQEANRIQVEQKKKFSEMFEARTKDEYFQEQKSDLERGN